jgi:hypothetical protein
LIGGSANYKKTKNFIESLNNGEKLWQKKYMNS